MISGFSLKTKEESLINLFSAFLPFDKFYDHVHIEKNKGEFYTNSLKECIKKGFRHVGKR